MTRTTGILIEPIGPDEDIEDVQRRIRQRRRSELIASSRELAIQRFREDVESTDKSLQ